MCNFSYLLYHLHAKPGHIIMHTLGVRGRHVDQAAFFGVATYPESICGDLPLGLSSSPPAK